MSSWGSLGPGTSLLIFTLKAESTFGLSKVPVVLSAPGAFPVIHVNPENGRGIPARAMPVIEEHLADFVAFFLGGCGGTGYSEVAALLI
jgi:hypothetical protein